MKLNYRTLAGITRDDECFYFWEKPHLGRMNKAKAIAVPIDDQYEPSVALGPLPSEAEFISPLGIPSSVWMSAIDFLMK